MRVGNNYSGARWAFRKQSTKSPAVLPPVGGVGAEGTPSDLTAASPAPCDMGDEQ